MSVHTTTSAWRRSLAAGALLPALALAAACGGDDPVAESAGSASSESASESSDQPYDEKTIIPAMQAALDDATSARIDMALTGQLEMSMSGQMLMADTFEEGEMELTLDFQGQTLDVRQVDGLLYLSGPPATPPGKWVEIDPQDTQNPMAQQFAGITKSGDLNTTFDAFKEGVQEVDHLGEEEIDGETTHHYVFTVDSAKAAQAQGQPLPPGAPQQLTYDVWLTDDDLMRRVTFQLGPAEAVIDATHWGEPVEVEAPPQGDIVQQP